MDTRQTEAKAMAYLFETILTGPRYQAAFKAWGVLTTTDILMVNQGMMDTADSFQVGEDDEADNLTTLNMMEKKRIVDLIEWYRAQNEQTTATWLKISPDLFDAFRLERVLRDGPTKTPPVVAVVPTKPSTPLDPVAEFNKGNRRSPGDLKHLKDDKQWSWWSHHLLTTANSQGIKAVLV